MENPKTIFSLPAKSTEFIPHRQTMLLVDELLEFDDGKIKATATIKKDNPFLTRSGSLSRNCLVEIMAQTVASGNGYHARVKGETVKTGFLVGVNDFTFYEDVAAGDKLTILTNEESSFGEFSIVEGSINKGNNLAAKGSLKVFEIPGAPEKTVDETPSIEKDKGKIGKKIPLNNKSPFFKAISESSADFSIGVCKEEAGASFLFNEAFPGFTGHFPDFPILPGVVMMETVMVLAEALSREDLKIVNISKAKFSKQSYPGDHLRGEISMAFVKDHWQISARLSCNGSPVSSLLLNAVSG